ncbi:hypothetical protein OO015_06685 [Thermomicrobium sp. 4228-Ro]|uniref:hypothetical protein n=1 Tax=Thermomicrobium sp. 4228-Ro TaxID=2993937 RepID=UPI002248FCB6|nr:hypothetical protein [Thermomicrobium sp. 4228-Ro]MCX2727181.1 hypothetical protein [Thermomicrobium sp. 4228-Ro]
MAIRHRGRTDAAAAVQSFPKAAESLDLLDEPFARPVATPVTPPRSHARQRWLERQLAERDARLGPIPTGIDEASWKRDVTPSERGQGLVRALSPAPVFHRPDG